MRNVLIPLLDSRCQTGRSDYGVSMKVIGAKATCSGNSRLRRKRQKKLSWKETYKQMAAAREDWSDLDPTIDDGLRGKFEMHSRKLQPW